MATNRTVEDIDVKSNRVQNKDINDTMQAAISALMHFFHVSITDEMDN